MEQLIMFGVILGGYYVVGLIFALGAFSMYPYWKKTHPSPSLNFWLAVIIWPVVIIVTLNSITLYYKDWKRERWSRLSAKYDAPRDDEKKQWDKKRKSENLQKANEIVSSHGLKAEYLGEDIFTVGVQGDTRTYAPAIVLIGPHPGWDVLALLSAKISNETEINKVTFEVARKP
jgi:hypothetical protein